VLTGTTFLMLTEHLSFGWNDLGSSTALRWPSTVLC